MSTASSESNKDASDKIAALLDAAGHFFGHLATACRATVKSLEASAVSLLSAEAPQVNDTAAKIEAVLADDIKAEVNADLPKVVAVVEQRVETAAPVILAEVVPAAVKAAEVAL